VIVSREVAATTRCGDFWQERRLLLSWAKAGKYSEGRNKATRDDWDVYYERGRKPKESIIKYEAARSEGDSPQPKSAGLPGITRQRVGLPLKDFLKIFRLNSLLLLSIRK